MWPKTNDYLKNPNTTTTVVVVVVVLTTILGGSPRSSNHNMINTHVYGSAYKAGAFELSNSALTNPQVRQ